MNLRPLGYECDQGEYEGRRRWANANGDIEFVELVLYLNSPS